MEQHRRTFSTENPWQSRPRKKTRRNSCGGDTALLLNESGIQTLQRGNEDEAETFFSLALKHVDCKTVLDAVPTSLSDSWLTNPPRYGEDLARHSDESLHHCQKEKLESTFLYIYQRQDYDEGMYVFSEALPLDSDLNASIRSATLLYNVAQTHVRRENYCEALRWFELALIRIVIDSSASISSLYEVRLHHNIGHCLYRLGKSAQAMNHFKKALQYVREGRLKPTLEAASRNCIAVLLFHEEESNSDACLFELLESLKIYREEASSNVKELATVVNNIGRVHYLRGEYHDALEFYKEALQLRRSHLGDDSIDVAATICNIGQTHQQLLEYKSAMLCYQEFLGLAQSRLGTHHRDIATIYKYIADIYQETGDLMNAKKMYELALCAGQKALGNSHPEVASILNKLGNLLFELNNLGAALMYYEKALEVQKVVFEREHPHTVVTMMNIAQIHRCNGNYASALNIYNAIHDIQMSANGPNSLIVAGTLSSMGLMQYQLKSYPAAFEFYQQALRIQRDCFGTDDHLDIASTLNSIGLVLFNQGVYILAKSCFADSLRIRQKLLGRNHREVAILWYNIATIYLETGDDDMAIKLYKETLRVEKEALGSMHHDVILTLQHLGLVHQQRGQLDEALQYFGEALEVERRRDGNNKVAIAKLLNLIGNIHLQRASVADMMDCYIEASRIYQRHGQQFDTLVIAGYNFYGLSKVHPPCAPTA